MKTTARSTSRRAFLQTSAAGSAALLAAGLRAANPAAPAACSKIRRLKWLGPVVEGIMDLC